MLKVSELAKRLNLSESKIYELAAQRKIEFHKFDGSLRFSEQAIETYLEQTRQERREDRESLPPPSPPQAHQTMKGSPPEMAGFFVCVDTQSDTEWEKSDEKDRGNV